MQADKYLLSTCHFATFYFPHVIYWFFTESSFSTGDLHNSQSTLCSENLMINNGSVISVNE